MKVLITGVTGFVGGNLLTYFNRQKEISDEQKAPEIYGVVRNRSRKSEFPGVPVLSGLFDFSELGDELDVDVVIHLAGKAHDVKRVDDESEYFKSNTDLTVRLYDAFLNSARPSRFIFISSVSAVGVAPATLTEESVPDPVTPYGKSKHLAEKHILEHPAGGGKKCYILRPSIIYGPNSKGNLNLLFSYIRKGFPYPLGAFQNQRSFLSVDNLSFMIDHLCREPVPSGIYHLADDESLSTLELVRLMCEALDRRPRVLNIPPSIVRAVARAGDYLRLPVNSERLDKLTQDYVVFNHKLMDLLGRELPVRTRDGLLEMFRSLAE